jgi:hypothetical protein
MSTFTHKHPTLWEEDFGHLFKVQNPPQRMISNIGRDCYLKMVPGMANPHCVTIDGHLVTPAWTSGARPEPTDQPRLFRVEGLQYDYKREICYRIYAYGGDTFGRPAAESEVIFVPYMGEVKLDYAVTTPPSWHQRKAGNIYGSVLLLKLTPSEAAARDLRPDETLRSRVDYPHIWERPDAQA